MTANDIRQNLGTLGRHMEHWANIGQTLSRYWEDSGQTLGRQWAEFGDIGQTLGRQWADIGKTFQFSHAIKDPWILSWKIRLFGFQDFLVFLPKIRLSGFLIQDETFRFSYPR